ncbi:MAG: PIN domain-containing protein, partial [Actinobacteria bacterium]|nr:PIN domain-containing protein [Actinomycetota bacterium]
MRVVLDTSVLLAPDLDLSGVEVAISSVSLAELHFGVLVARSPEVHAERLRRLALIERNFDALPVDDSVAREYGRLAAAVVLAGRQPRARVADLLIAATAAIEQATVWRHNAKDLVGLEDLIE